MKKIALLLMSVCALMNASAQTLSGKLVRKGTAQPIEGVSVLLQDSMGNTLQNTTTAASGGFKLDLPKISNSLKATLRITRVGYTPQIVQLVLCAHDMDLGVMALEEKVTSLEEVNVTANGSLRADGYTLFPSKRMAALATSGYDFIRKLRLPDIRVDEAKRSVKTQAGGNVLILLNDRPASVADILTLKSKMVKRVVYVNSPGAEYAAKDYGAVVKLYVAQPHDGVRGGFNTSNSFTTASGENFAYLTYNRKLSEIGFTYENEYTHVRKRTLSQTDNYLIDEDHAYTIEKTGLPTPLRYMTNRATLHYNRTKSEQSVLNVELAGQWYESPDRSSRQRVSEEGYPAYDVLYAPTEHYFSPDLDVFFQKHFSRGASLSYNAHATYIDTDYGYAYKENHPRYGQRDYSYDTKGKKVSLINEFRYEQPVGRQLLSLGTRYMYGKTQNDYTSEKDTRNEMDSHDLYFYGQISGSLHKLRYNAGIGASMQRTEQEGNSTQSWLLRPRLSLSLPVRSWTLQYRFSLTPIAPTLSMLSDVSQQSNSWEKSKGNPWLKSYKLWSNRLAVQKSLIPSLSMSLQTGWTHASNAITPNITMDKETENPVFVQSYLNAGHSDNLWGMLSLQWTAVQDVLNVTGTLVHQYYDMAGKDYSHRLNDTNFTLDAELTLGHWDVALSAMTRTRTLDAETVTTDKANLSLSVRYYLKGWTVGMYATNLFQTYGMREETELLNKLHHYYQDLRVPSMGNMFGITVSWNFSKGRKHQAGESTIQNSDNDAGILKF